MCVGGSRGCIHMHTHSLYIQCLPEVVVLNIHGIFMPNAAQSSFCEMGSHHAMLSAWCPSSDTRIASQKCQVTFLVMQSSVGAEILIHSRFPCPWSSHLQNVSHDIFSPYKVTNKPVFLPGFYSWFALLEIYHERPSGPPHAYNLLE